MQRISSTRPWLFVGLFLLISHVVFASLDESQEKEFQEIKKSERSLIDAISGSMSVSKAVGDHLSQILSRPDRIKREMLRSSAEPFAYKKFLLDRSIRYAIDHEGNYREDERKGFALAAVSALRDPGLDEGGFRKYAFRNFSRKLYPELPPKLRESVKNSLFQYINQADARVVALPAVIAIGEFREIIRYIAMVDPTEDPGTLIRVCEALRVSKELQQVRIEPRVLDFLVQLIKHRDIIVRDAAKSLLVDTRGSALSKVNLLHPFARTKLIAVLADQVQSDDVKLTVLQMLRADCRTQWFNPREDFQYSDVYQALVPLLRLDASPALRAAAISVVSAHQVADPGIQSLLLTIASLDPDQRYSQAAFEALGKNSVQRFEHRITDSDVDAQIYSSMTALLQKPNRSMDDATRINDLAEIAVRNRNNQIQSFILSLSIWRRLTKILNEPPKQFSVEEESIALSLFSAKKKLESVLGSGRYKNISGTVTKDHIPQIQELSFLAADEAWTSDPQDLSFFETAKNRLYNNLSTKELIKIDLAKPGAPEDFVAIHILNLSERGFSTFLATEESDRLMSRLLSTREHRAATIRKLETFRFKVMPNHIATLLQLFEISSTATDEFNLPQRSAAIIAKTIRSPLDLAKLPIWSEDFATRINDIYALSPEGSTTRTLIDLMITSLKKRGDYSTSLCAELWRRS
jgi:hypothetical protein